MVEIGGKPILWHIMKSYSFHGINDFVICCGYKGYLIKEYFTSYFLHMCDLTLELRSNKMEFLSNGVEPWKVTLIDTGENTMTGGRLKRVRQHIGNETFCFTYGDGVSDLDIRKLISFHREQGGLATLTAVQPAGRFGAFSLEHEQCVISSFKEKPDGGSGWINGGFFVFDQAAFDHWDGEDLEVEVLPALGTAGRLYARHHVGFWKSMDTYKDALELSALASEGSAPWLSPATPASS